MPLKICPNCHRGCNEDNEYCPTCKTKFPDVPKNIPTVENPTSGSGADKSPSINPVIVVIAIVGLIIVAYFSMGLFFPKTGESASNLQGSGSSSTSLITPTPTYNSATAAQSVPTNSITPSVANNQQESSITLVPSAPISGETTPVSQITSAGVTPTIPITDSSTIGTFQPTVSEQTPNPTATLTSQQLLNSGGKGKIAFFSGSGLYVMNADGTGLTSLINSVPVDNLAWSPDGSKIVIANGEIETLNADGSGLTIVNNEYGDYNAIWSQDGKRIFFYSIGRTLNDRGFFMINADGSGKTLLNNKSMVVTDTFTLSPDDTKIAFTNSVTYNSNVNSNTWSCPEVFVSNLDGTGSTRLTFNPRVCGPQLINQVGNSNPVWSPDGKKIAFISSGRFADIGGLGDPYDRISVINADGTGQSYLTYDTDTLSWNPVWSPDSTKIAYISNKDGPDNIYVMNADGTDQTRLTNVNNDLYLAWG